MGICYEKKNNGNDSCFLPDVVIRVIDFIFFAGKGIFRNGKQRASEETRFFKKEIHQGAVSEAV